MKIIYMLSFVMYFEFDYNKFKDEWFDDNLQPVIESMDDNTKEMFKSVIFKYFEKSSGNKAMENAKYYLSLLNKRLSLNE